MTDKDINRKLQKMEEQLELITSSLASRNPERSLPNPDSRGSFFERNESQLAAAGVSDEIDLRELFSILWQGKWWIIGVTFLFFAASLVYALSLPNTYKSEVLLAPAEENSGGGLAGKMGQLGGLASLAGVNIGGGETDKIFIAIEVLKSREFISKFIVKYNLLVPLMAAKGWDRSGEQLLIDRNIYDDERKLWVRKPTHLRPAKPTQQEAYKKFIKLLGISKDKETNLVSVSVEHYSPVVAKDWVDGLVKSINEEVKRRKMVEAKKSIKYLTDQLGKTSIADMQAVFYELIEDQTKTVMFAEVRDEYVFKTIDRAVVPEQRVGPKKSLICVLGTVLGGIIGVVFMLISCFVKKINS